MPLPANSTLTLQGQPRPGDVLQSHAKPKQAMLIRMSAETFEAMADQQSLPKLLFEFGDKPGIYVGDTFYPVKANAESPHHELYLRLPSAQKPMAPLKFYANVVGKFMVQRQLGDKVVETVRDRTIEAEKQRTERKTVLLEGPPNLNHPGGSKTKGKKESSALRRAAVTSSSLTPSAAKITPQPPSSSHTNGSSREDPHARARLIHCLALKPRTADMVIKMCFGKDSTSRMQELMTLLQAVADPALVAKSSDQDALQRPWQLKLDSWREVRPYQWPKYTSEERLQTSRKARNAFKDLKIPETDPIWNHVRYRTESDQMSGMPGRSGAGPSAPAAEKNGVMSRNVKKVKTGEGARKKEKLSEIAIPSKDESGKGKGREVDQGSTAGTPTSATRALQRRLPGSGFKVKQSATPPISDHPRANSPLSKRERPASPDLSIPARAPPPVAPPAQESRSASVTAAQPRKNARDDQVSSTAQRVTERVKEEPSRERDYSEKPRLKERASPMPPSTLSFKRKKRAQDANDSDRSEGELPLSASVPKKRKLDESAAPAEKLRARDLSLPKKPAMREPSPRIKKEASPFSSALSPPPAASRSSLPSRPPAVDREQSQRSSGKGRRKSPIYTSSEDESEPNVSAAARSRASTSQAPEAASASVKRLKAYMQRFKPRPLPADRVGLRKYYSSCYEVYYHLYSEQSQRRDRIKRMLRDAEGEERRRGAAGESDEDADVEELTPEVIMGLMDDLGAVTAELRKVRQTWERLGGKVDSAGELMDD